MQFFDVVTVKCSSGAWGDWCVAARREKYVPYWWPSGGNWGKWWSIILRGDEQLTTLATLHAQKHIKASHGEAWKIKEQYGKDAEDSIVLVPLGTLVRDETTGHIVAHVQEHWEEIVLMAWWRWWVWNMHFSNSVNQYSNFWLLWEPGQSKLFTFELLLLADVALLGFPSVGKTSLLNTVSSAAAKTAEYHFTTLIPNLGVVNRADNSFVMIDVPGLIEWAAGWKWLWNEFLRHVMKARAWVIVVDFSTFEAGLWQAVALIEEITAYVRDVVYVWKDVNQRLLPWEWSCLIWEVTDAHTWVVYAKKQCLFLWNKIDLVVDQEIREELIRTLSLLISKHPLAELTPDQIQKAIYLVSAGSQEWIDTWIRLLWKELPNAQQRDHPFLEEIHEKVVIPRTRDQLDQLFVKDITDEQIDWLINNWYLEEKEQKYVRIREVEHPEMGYLSFVIPWWNDEAELRYRRVLEKKKILKQLEHVWVRKGDVFLIKSPYAGKDDRRVRRV